MKWSIGKRIKSRAQARAEEIQKRRKIDSGAQVSPPPRSAAVKRRRRRTEAKEHGKFDIEYVGTVDKAGNFRPCVEQESNENVRKVSEENEKKKKNVRKVSQENEKKHVEEKVSGKSVSEEIVEIFSDSEPEISLDANKSGDENARGTDSGFSGFTSDDEPSECEEEDDDVEDKDYRIVESESSENLISSSSSSDDEEDDDEDEDCGFTEKIGEREDGGLNKGKKAKQDDLENADSSMASKTGENEGKKAAQMKRKSSGKHKEVGSLTNKSKKHEKELKRKHRKETRDFEIEEEGRATKTKDKNVEKERPQQHETVFTCAHCGKMAKGVSGSDISFAKLQTKKAADEPAPEPEQEQQYSKKLPSADRARTEDFVSDNSERKSRKPSTEEGEQEKKAKKAEAKKSSGWRMVGGRKDLDIFGLLVNSVWEENRVGEDDPVSSSEEESKEQEGNEEEYDENGLLVIKPPPLILDFGWKEPEPPVLSEFQREEQRLWEEMAFCLRSIQMGFEFSSGIGEKEKPEESRTDENPATLCRKGNHKLYLDLEIGLKCIYCGFVEAEIRHLDASEWGNKNTNPRRKKDRSGEEDETMFEKLGLQVPDKNSSAGSGTSEGTVWDVIPGTKSGMYPHQQEGFEFIWKNLAGTIVLNELKSFETSNDIGGCIISHAPGTGKTRLTIVFLQSYFELFPDCRPVIIAPASLLLTWEEEFKKWNMDVPFHNLSNLEFSGKESSMAVKILEERRLRSRSKNDIRMVKLFSWSKRKSILGISYNLYEKLAGEKIDKGRRKKTDVKLDKEREEIRKILLEIPGLLVLDEAHTPRNQRSCIWKTLSKVRTQKRILLSGTPFQNNFLELCNVLCLARPAYLEMLSSMLKKRKMTTIRRSKGKFAEFGASADEINNGGIEELKCLMVPFVNVHKGSILQKNLPGLRDCVVVLDPPDLQKKVLEAIEVSQNVFEIEHKLSVASIHPSLLCCCSISKKEQLVLDQTFLEQLQKIRLDPNQSVKTRFLMEFIRLCDVINEKVLVFSQYIDPLSLILEQLSSLFNWLEGKEVFYMHGRLDQKQRQSLINKFNDPKSEAKVILASTKACSEGINLVGASRVVLLDVVWNPSVERQAISRAYRIGQKRIVYTYHLVTKGTPECQKYCKQAEKHRISELVFASGNEKGKMKSSEAVAEDKVLEEMVQHVKLQDMFEKLIYQPKEADLVEGFSSVVP